MVDNYKYAINLSSNMNEKTDVFIELHVPNFQTAIDFYKILGFAVVWINDEYLVMKKDASALFFYPGDERVYSHSYFGKFPKGTKRGYGVEIILYDKNVKELYERIKEKVKVVKKLEKKRWGDWDFRIEDPFGYYIRIGEPQNILNDKEKISKTKEVAKKRGLKI